MLELVTIDDARQQLRLDEIDSNGGADDAWLALAIPGVSEAVRSWLKDDWRLYLPERDTAGAVITDTDGDPIPSDHGPDTLRVQLDRTAQSSAADEAQSQR